MILMDMNVRFERYEEDKVGKDVIIYVSSLNKVVLLNQSAACILRVIQRFENYQNNVSLEMVYDEMMRECGYTGVEKNDVIDDINAVIDSFFAAGILCPETENTALNDNGILPGR